MTPGTCGFAAKILSRSHPCHLLAAADMSQAPYHDRLQPIRLPYNQPPLGLRKDPTVERVLKRPYRRVECCSTRNSRRHAKALAGVRSSTG